MFSGFETKLKSKSFIVGCLVGAVTLLALGYIKKKVVGPKCKINKDLNNKIAVITGGNAGIGKQTVKQLIKRNCIVAFGARDQQKSDNLIKQILKQYPNADIRFIKLDLGDKQSINHFSNQIHQHYQRIDYLINNAGLLNQGGRKTTKDGFQITMGVNHLGHFYLTYLLWDMLKKSFEPRVINVSSMAHKGNNFDFLTDINYENNQYSVLNAYRRSKAANILFAKQLQNKINNSSTKIQGKSVSLHPGFVRTQFLRNTGFVVKMIGCIFYPLYWLVSKSQNQGAQTILYTVLSDKQNLADGGYYSNCSEDQPIQYVKSKQNMQKLWQISEELLNIKFDL